MKGNVARVFRYELPDGATLSQWIVYAFVAGAVPVGMGYILDWGPFALAPWILLFGCVYYPILEGEHRD